MGVSIWEGSKAASLVDSLNEVKSALWMIGRNTVPDITSMAEIANIVKAGNADKVFQIGDQIAVPWTDTSSNTEYSMVFDIVHFGDATLEDQEVVPGMFLQARYAHPFGVQFSHPRAFYKCPSGLAAGTYYITITEAAGNNVSANDVVCFTTTVAIPENGRIGGLDNAPGTTKANWRIKTYAADGKTVLETITPTFSASGTSLGTLGATRSDNMNCASEAYYGANNYKNSAIRQYLNSAAGADAWWAAQDGWDIVPDQITKAGFLAGFQNDFINAIKPVKVSQATNTVIDDGTTQDMYDRVFLPSLQEMHFVPQVADAEGVIWEYWKRVSGSSTPLPAGTAYPQMRTFGLDNKNSAQTVRLRSASRGLASDAWHVGTSGGASGSHVAPYAYRFAPAVVIC